MKIQLLGAALALFAMGANAQITESAADAVKNMGLGWNLGNTLDANSGWGSDFNKESYWGTQGIESENNWGQATTTNELMTMMKEAGFGAIRVPATWFNHMDIDGNVDPAWMNRVHEVVDYVISNDMYCILNVHHDTGAGNSWIKADADNFAINQQRYENLWSQIANVFSDYGEKLIFESYNEMLDKYNSWCFATFASPKKYDAEEAVKAYEGLNSYAQSFVNVVRASGGNNSTRNLIVNTYAAANGYGNWSKYLQEPLTELQLPTDEAGEGHLIVEVHTYPSINNNGKDRPLNDIKKEVDGMIDLLNKEIVSRGVPVIFGEWGTNNVDAGAGKTDYDVRRDLMFDFVTYFIEQTKANDMGTFFWMGLTDGVFRGFPAFSQADLAECMTKAYHGADFEGVYPTLDEMETMVCFEGDKLLQWGNGITIEGKLIKDFGAGVEVVLDYTQNGPEDDIQLFYGDWSSKPNFRVDGQTFPGDFNPGLYYGTPDGTEHQTVITFDAKTYETVAARGLVIHGNSIRLSKVTLRKGTVAIENVRHDEGNAIYYNLNGQRISKPQSGLFIQVNR